MYYKNADVLRDECPVSKAKIVSMMNSQFIKQHWDYFKDNYNSPYLSIIIGNGVGTFLTPFITIPPSLCFSSKNVGVTIAVIWAVLQLILAVRNQFVLSTSLSKLSDFNKFAKEQYDILNLCISMTKPIDEAKLFTATDILASRILKLKIFHGIFYGMIFSVPIILVCILSSQININCGSTFGQNMKDQMRFYYYCN